MILGSDRDYVDHCVEKIGQIDPIDLAGREIGTITGKNDSSLSPTRFYPLGRFVLATETEYLGLKLGNSSGRNRLISELTDLNFILGRNPELAPLFPSIMGLVQIGDDHSYAFLLEEDASSDGFAEVRSSTTSPDTRQKIIDTFPDVELHEETLELHCAFDVRGKERLLDLKPSIFSMGLMLSRQNAIYEESLEKVFENEAGLTIEIDEKSALAQSIAEKYL